MDEAEARRAFDTALATHAPAFESFFLARLFGLSFTYGDDRLTVDFPVHDFMFNPQGSLHGGVIAFVADVSMGHLLKHSYGVPGATLEIKLQYLKPLRQPSARCVSRFLRQGRSVCFLEAVMSGPDGEPAVVATSTWQIPKPREPQPTV